MDIDPRTRHRPRPRRVGTRARGGPGGRVRRDAAVLLGAVLLLPACVPAPAPAPAPAPGSGAGVGTDGGGPADPARAAASEAVPADGIVCGAPLAPAEGRRVQVLPVAGLAPAVGTPTALALALLGEAGSCGGRLVLAPDRDPTLRTLAAATAILRDEPLLVLPGDATGWDDQSAAAATVLARRLGGLGLVEASAFGAAPAWVDERLDRVVDLSGPLGADGAARTAADPVAALLRLLDEHPSPATTVVLVAADDVGAQVDVLGHVAAGLRPLVVDPERTDLDLDALLAPLRDLDPAPGLAWAASDAASAVALGGVAEDVGLARWGPPAPDEGAGELWLGDVRAPAAAAVTAVAAARRGMPVLAVDGADPRTGAERTSRLRALDAGLAEDATLVVVGVFGPDADWQLDTVLEGTPLPDGGFLPLEDRRIVALYGSPGAPSLGLLGQQDLEATLELAREYAAGYADATDGRAVVPGLDVIATVASSAPEPTGDFSRRVPIATLRPLVTRAGEEGMAVLLDLQPGRTDFLTQAQEYEELLREPHVHLALDPEWRIGPTERHLQRIGSVEAAEVQAVVDWLAALVRREHLPQKVLMLHQFTLGMLLDRDTVVIPPELVGVVHVDGQGPLPTKDRTYAVMTSGAEERWAWGWKNFTRIDAPMATPERTLDRAPVPVIVTYQ